MATAKRATKTRSVPATRSKPAAPATRAKAATKSKKSAPRSAAAPAADISPVTGLPTREKVHLPIKGYGRYNSFQVVELLYGKSPAELKLILAYEEKHQARRMIIDRIHDMLRRAGQK